MTQVICDFLDLWLFPAPAFGERRHRGLARRRIAVRRHPILVVPEGERPHPGRTDWRRMHFQDATDHRAIGEHVEVVVVPIARWAACRGAFEDQGFAAIRHRKAGSPPHSMQPGNLFFDV
jgi:hypothetical protein